MHTSVRVYVALGVTILFWGLSFIATKAALGTIDPFAIIFLRFIIAAAVFAVILARNGFPRFSRSDHLKMALLAVFEPGLYFFCETFGLRLTSASVASLIIAAVPLAVALLARVLLAETLSPKNILSIALSIAGISILVLGDPTFGVGPDASLFGDLLIIGAVITAAFYMIIARDLGRSRSALDITAMQVFYGALIFAPFFFSTAGNTHWNKVPLVALLAVLFLGLFATVVSYLSFNFALTRLPASRAAVFLNGVPVVTSVAGWLFLGERLSPLQIAGAILVLVAVTFNSTAPGSRRINHSVSM
ncbi:MAG TPA: DMT family transporter [Spirochaetia bacterium]|nr:DMT family transporter [Spirochaetia bacterium]